LIFNDETKKTLGKAAVGGSTLGVLYGLDPTSFMHILSETANSQIAQAGFFFTLATWIHANKVRAEIKANFLILTEAINNVAEALRSEMEIHSKRLDNLQEEVDDLKKGGIKT
jgi:hypothetical protein